MHAKTDFSLGARIRSDRAAAAALKPSPNPAKTNATLERAREAIRRASETLRRRPCK